MKCIEQTPKKNKRSVEISLLKKLFTYDPHIGDVVRRINQGTRGRKGDVAGAVGLDGYLSVGINGKNYKLHRVAWAIHFGAWPEIDLDHKNGDRKDNRLSNLRLATATENACNRPAFKNNKSGYKGVSWNKHDKKWVAFIRLDRKLKYLGSFDDPSVAHQAYVAAAVVHHGEFANAGGSR